MIIRKTLSIVNKEKNIYIYYFFSWSRGCIHPFHTNQIGFPGHIGIQLIYCIISTNWSVQFGFHTCVHLDSWAESKNKTLHSTEVKRKNRLCCLMFLAKHVVNTTKFTVSMIGTNWRAQFGLHVGVRFELPGPAKFPSDQKKF